MTETGTVDPAAAMALNSRGMEALGRRDFAAAAELFAQAAAADPEAPPLWINLATARRGAGDAEGERASLNRVLSIDQRHLTANIRLAELHERLGETASATQRWSGVLALGSAMPEPPSSLAPLLAHARDYVGRQSAKFGDLVDFRPRGSARGGGRR